MTKYLPDFCDLTFADPRSNGKVFLENPPIVMSLLIFAYLVMVYYGPQIMKKRKVVDLKRVLVIYNLLQVIINFAFIAMVSKDNNLMNHFYIKTLTVHNRDEKAKPRLVRMSQNWEQ